MTKNYGKLTFTLPNQRRKEFLLTEPRITIGRAPNNDLILDWGSVADYHCRIDCSSSGCTIVNLQSDNPLWIDNKQVEEARLIAGNVIQLGRGRLRYSGPMMSASEGAATVINTGKKTTIRIDDEPVEAQPSRKGEVTMVASSAETIAAVSAPTAPLDNAQTPPAPPRERPQRTTIRTIGRYEVHEMLGYRGNFVVYRGRDPQLDRTVAIKILSTQFPADDSMRANIQREVELIAGLEHPHIVQVYDFGENNKQPYVVMPFLDAGTLTAKLAEEGPLPLTEAAEIFTAVAGGLDLAHNQKIIHRQLKPNNILFDGTSTYISDFGISTIDTAIERGSTADLSWAHYISPEQAQILLNKDRDSIKVRFTSDIYSMGVILFEILTGAPPFTGATPEAIAHAHLEEPIPDLSDINPDLNREYQYIINKALAKNPADRHDSAGEFAQHLNEIAEGRWYIGQLTRLDKMQRERLNEALNRAQIAQRQEIDVTINLYSPLPIEEQVKTATAEAEPHPLAGRTIGRYEIERPIGKGGMASVYLARDPIMDRQVAVKVLPPKLMENPKFRQLFHHEAKIVAGLRHKSIVSVFDFGEHSGQPFIVMQYLRGGTLADELANGPVTIKGVLPIIERVAEAIDEANSQNVIHRDVKPANIIFNAEGEAFLSDFGIAVISAAASNKKHYAGGTPRYMSPEQAYGIMANKPTKLDGRSDVYSLGAVLYHMLTGEIPYPADGSPISMIRSHITAPIPQVRDLMPNLPAAWQEIINRALAKKPSERYQTAGELAADVHEIGTGRWYLRKLLD